MAQKEKEIPSTEVFKKIWEDKIPEFFEKTLDEMHRETTEQDLKCTGK